MFHLPWPLNRLSSLVACALSGLAWSQTSPAPAELRGEGQGDPQDAQPCAFEGLVFTPDGRAARGALVLTSAGGQAIVGADGRYRLEVLVPSDVERIHVTAVGNGSPSMTASASILAPWGRVGVEPLTLVQGSSCSPSWLPTFGPQPGTSAQVYALATFDDGNGPALYAGGSFQWAGGVEARSVARWDGSTWAGLGGGTDGSVSTLAVYDDGSGPALYAGGLFTVAGSVTANHLARWDGSSWSSVGSGMNGEVLALAGYDDGNGTKLYAGGAFTTAGGTPAIFLACWNGASWSSPGSMSGGVRDFLVHDDGGGAALFVAGDFTSVGGLAANRIARWNGASWSAVGSGFNSSVMTLVEHDDGSGPALYAGGHFTSAGGSSANRVARWNGSSWSRLGVGTNNGVNDTVRTLAAFDDGSGLALFASGFFETAGGSAANYVARWNGSTWSPLGSGLNYRGQALAVFDDGDGPALFVGGEFLEAGGEGALYLARWNGSNWTPTGKGLHRPVSALVVYDDGSGPALHVGGGIKNGVHRWDGESWTTLGLTLGEVSALAVYDDGSGPVLYAGGFFFDIDGVMAAKIARWNGSSWSPLLFRSAPGLGPDHSSVYSLVVHDDGSGPALYAGGSFWYADTLDLYGIGRWDGSNWSRVGSGFSPGNGVVYSLAVHDDGSGTRLYAGGYFTTAGGVSANHIARWNGSSWSAMGNGMDNHVRALKVHDDGGGHALYAAGAFTSAGGVAANRIARWNGASWTALGTGLSHEVIALASHDDGSGPALYATGPFTTAGGVAANRIARWDGASWSPLGSGLGDNGGGVLLVHDNGGGPALYVGGSFSSAIDSRDGFLARFGCDTLPPVLSCPRSVRVVDRWPSPPGEVVTFLVEASDDQTVPPTVVCTPASGSFFPRGRTLVTCTATDAAGNVSTCTFPVEVLPKARPR